jgi:hypothetical protein
LIAPLVANGYSNVTSSNSNTILLLFSFFIYFLFIYFLQICSLLRGGIAERGGVRVGHRIIEINNQSVVAVPHEKIVNLLATSTGEVRHCQKCNLLLT